MLLTGKGLVADLVAKHFIFLLQAIILAAIYFFVVLGVAHIFKSGVETFDEILLGIKLSIEVSTHRGVIMLESFILSLELHQLPLKLLNPVSSPRERLREVTTHRRS